MRIWDEYRLIIQSNAAFLEDNPSVATRLVFRLERAKFYISQLDFWYKTGDMQKFEEAADQARQNLEDLYQLISELTREDDRDEE